MSKRTTARHRATPVRTAPLEAVSQAVSSNAGAVGRQAAVVAATSGLVLSIGLPAQGSAPAVRETTSIPAAGLEIERASLTTVNVTAAKDVQVKLDRAEVASRPAPEPEPAPVVRETPAAEQAAEAPARTAAQTQTQAQTQTAEPAVSQQRAERAAQQERAAERAAQQQRAERAAQQERAERAAQQERAAQRERAAERAAQQQRAERAAQQERTQRAQRQAASAPAPQQQAPARATGNMGAVVSAAYSGIGVRYVYGGKTRAGWDCSGFTSWAYRQAGISIPSSTSAIRASGQFVRTSNPKPGDLVFQNGGGHVGIYVGNGMMIGAQNPSVGTFMHPVTRNPLYGYYTYVG